jgi:hypothetical protein
MVDLLGAIAAMRIARSAWTLLPEYSELTAEQWRPYLSRATAVRELWPSQRMLGAAGLFAGQSAVVQMPTSAGKTRAISFFERPSCSADKTRHNVAPFRPSAGDCEQPSHAFGDRMRSTSSTTRYGLTMSTT